MDGCGSLDVTWLKTEGMNCIDFGGEAEKRNKQGK